ncbi:MAG: hypothetical protein DCC65_10625 [Planctomycetota bacterium]|nr:MAG: hypothetical protein DCC65_10625 [Planctomycetota bacterium]
MAKPLRDPPPTSSVARLLDVEAAIRAVAPAQPAAARPTEPANRDLPVVSVPPPSRPTESPPVFSAPTPSYPAGALTGEPANIKRELVLSPSTEETFSRLVEVYRRSTGTRLSNSHVARAMLKGLAACMTSLEREADAIGRLRLPGNARGREGERERFEDRIAEAFVNGVRSAAAYRRKDQSN